MNHTCNKPSSVRVPMYDFYWVAAEDPYDLNPVYRVRDRRDVFDQRVWDEGRYFLSREDAIADILRRKKRHREMCGFPNKQPKKTKK